MLWIEKLRRDRMTKRADPLFVILGQLDPYDAQVVLRHQEKLASYPVVIVPSALTRMETDGRGPLPGPD